MNNNLITAAPSTGAAILPSAFGTNLIQTQTPRPPSPSSTSTHAATTAQFNCNPFIQLIPTQINGPLIAGNMNISASEGCPTLSGSNTTTITSGDNRNTLTFMPQMAFITSAGVTQIPGPSYGDLTSTLQQQTTSSLTPMISVITSTNNNNISTNNPHNTTQSFLIPSGGGAGISNNTILTPAAPMAITPINVILTNNCNDGVSSSNTMANGITSSAAAGSGIKHSVGTPIMEMKSNSVMPTSVLICNRPQYAPQHLPASNNNKLSTPSRNSIYANPTQMTTVFNPELVKQIVVGNAPKNSVITHATSTSRNAHVAANSSASQTLLKSTAVVKQQTQHNPTQKNTTFISQTPLVSTMAVSTTTGTGGSIPTTYSPTTKKQTPTVNTNTVGSTSKATSILESEIKAKVPLAEAAKAIGIASSSVKTTTAQSSGLRAETKTGSELVKMIDILDISSERFGKMPPATLTTSKVEPSTPSPLSLSSSIQANVSVIKTTTVMNEPINASKIEIAVNPGDITSEDNKQASAVEECSADTLKVDIDLMAKPSTLAQAQKASERQESLLKSRPIQSIIDCNTSPRSKRSKSLSCTAKEAHNNTQNSTLPTDQQTMAERRHSTASDSGRKISNKKSTPTRRKQSLMTTSDIIKEYDIIDLIDYNEEERNIIERQLKKIDSAEEEEEGEAVEEKCIDKHADANIKVKQHDFKDMKDVKPQTTEHTTQLVIEDTNLKSANENNAEENELTEGSSLKIEIVVEETAARDDASEALKQDQIDHAQQSTESAENVEIIFQETKIEDTQTSVEHTQDSLEKLEKSLYCDEKISISSTSTSSSRQSLHDDMLHAAPSTSSFPAHSHRRDQSQNMSSRMTNQPSTSAAAAAAAGIPLKAMGSSLKPTEDSMSCALKMLSNFNMLTWNQRIGSARGTNMRFQLNEFNLIEINERCGPRTRVHTAYEKPVYERESVASLSEKHKGLLYLCRRCKCHGPALDFLAPEFCSLDCLKRDSRKRRHEEPLTVTHKRRSTAQEATIPLFPSKKSFRWSTYLPEKFNAIAAPVNLFINPFPSGLNKFQIGMKLEAIDPENCALFCVCTIVDIQGYRLKLTFDGYEYMYDFWVNADSMDIFPPGWCAKTKRVLQPPKGKTAEEFSWSAYLIECKAIAAQRVLFTHLNVSLGTHNPFKLGMHLEAEDLNDTGKLCVASIADVLDNRIRVHFDGWDDCYDYWVDISSPYIHPCGWHAGRQQLIVPPEFENSSFSWNDYIKHHGSGMAATEEMFSTRLPIEFKPNMKLEVVDPRNPSLIRPATIVGRKGHRVKLHLDCWASTYCFWLEDDSADLHPIGWCEATGHELEPPPGYKMRSAKIVCSTYGCRGIGNARRLYLNTHETRDCCPYAPDNWRQKSEKPPRLEHDEIIRVVAGAQQREQQVEKKPLVVQWKELQQQQQLQRRQQQQRELQQQQQKQQHQLNKAQILQQIQLLDNIKTRQLMPQETQQQQQQKHAANQPNLHANDIPNAQTQQISLIKTESTHHPTTTTATAKATVDESTSLLLPQIKIAKEFLYDYGPRLQQNYTIWQRNCAFDMQRIKRNPLCWSTKDTCAFVQCVLRNPDTTERFLRQDIDGNALLLLQQNDLTDVLKLKLGPAVKLYSCILQLRTLTAVKFDVKLRNAMQKKH